MIEKQDLVKRIKLNDRTLNTILVGREQEINFDWFQDEIIEALKENTTVKALIIDFDSDDYLDMEQLGALLKINRSIENLYIAYYCAEWPIPAFQSFCEGIKENDSLKELSLIDDNLSHAHVQTFSKFFRHNRSIKKLTIHSSLGYEIPLSLVSASVEGNTVIEELKLRYFYGTDQEPIKVSVNKLLQHPSLISLSVNSELTNADLQYIAKKVGNNCSIQKLALNFGDFDDNAIPSICTLIGNNPGLNSINLSNNRLGIEAENYMCAFLQSNTRLLCLKGIENDEINQLVNRNLSINSALQLIEAYDKEQSPSSEAIEMALQALLAIPEDCTRTVEISRLLTAIGQLLYTQDLFEAFSNLCGPFEDKQCAKIASKTMGQLIATALSPSFYTQDDPKITEARCCFTLYSFRFVLDNELYRNFAYTALYQLIVKKKFSPDLLADFKDSIILLGAKACKALIREAMLSGDISDPDKQLLGLIIGPEELVPASLVLLNNSPYFWKTFQTIYPKATSFTLPEYCIYMLQSEQSPLIHMPKVYQKTLDSILLDHKRTLEQWLSNSEQPTEETVLPAFSEKEGLFALNPKRKKEEDDEEPSEESEAKKRRLD